MLNLIYPRMKKNLLLLIVFILVQSKLLAQNRIYGIGPFKIKRTDIAIIDSLSQELGEFERVDNTVRTYSVDHYECIFDSLDVYSSPQGASACKSIRTFFIKKLEISGVSFESLYLVFKDGILREFKSDYSNDIQEALSIKYGPPKIKTSSKPVTCLYKLTGNKSQLEETAVYYEWISNYVQINAGYSKFYNDKCEELHTSWFSVDTKEFYKEKEACESAAERKMEQNKMNEKAKSLKNF